MTRPDPPPPIRHAASVLPDEAPLDRLGLLWLAVLALPAGATTGLVCALFRMALDQADLLREMLVARAQPMGLQGLAVLVAAGAAATMIAAWLVRRFAPLASGSGIPHVEAVLRERVEPAGLAVLPVKFLGGTLAIGAGLALGREGPSVQMGASIGTAFGRIFRRPGDETRALLAACAGAGLATAFNAPIAGAVFVLEELVQRFEHRKAIAALAASAAAIAIARLLLGDAADFALPPIPAPVAEAHPLFFALGLVMGLLAVGYNALLLATLDLAERVPVLLRAALVGGAVAAIAFAMPSLVGGGDALTERSLAGVEDLALLPLLFLARLALGATSYAAATPGGLFAPLLVLGAQGGLLFGAACRDAFPTLAIEPAGFALVGMAAFFAGAVRAPVTGIILVTEMTANVALLQPMLGACFLAMLVPSLLRSAPIYESLRLRVRR